jgi:hypothetical protein
MGSRRQQIAARHLPVTLFAVALCCGCGQKESEAPAGTSELAAVVPAIPGVVTDGGSRAADAGSGPDDSPMDASVARGGRLCVAPLDYSETPGKGAMTVEGFGDGPSPTPRNAKAIVEVNGERQEITLKQGARFDDLPLRGRVVVSLASPGQRPYFSRKISFEKEGARALCLYENPFYATVQISDVPRRPFCRKCMKDDGQ